jgi:hypothetical protein
MENEDRRIEQVDKATVVITGIKAEMEKDNSELIKRISFETNKGAITWKPKTDKKVFQNGFQVIRTLPMTLEELPDKMKVWANIIQTEGKIIAIVNYTTMTVDKDGEDVTYRFITSEKAFATWELQVSSGK